MRKKPLLPCFLAKVIARLGVISDKIQGNLREKQTSLHVGFTYKRGHGGRNKKSVIDDMS